MVGHPISRRSLVTAAAVGATTLAGCTGEGSCRTVFDGTERVQRGRMRVYDVEVAAGERLYLSFRRVDGPRATLSVFDPAEELVVGLEAVDQLERVIEITDPGRYAVVVRNDSTAGSGRWEMTVAAYRGWCADVF